MLLTAGASVHSSDEALDRTPLHYAAQHGHSTVCELLIEMGACCEALDISNCTPLHLAAERGMQMAVETLMRAGASPVARSSNGCCPLHLAAHNNHIAATGMLLAGMQNTGSVQRRGPSSYDQLRNNYEKTPMDHAREHGHSVIVDMLERATLRSRQEVRFDLGY